jgi:hypothetical protein
MVGRPSLTTRTFLDCQAGLRKDLGHINNTTHALALGRSFVSSNEELATQIGTCTLPGSV